MSHLRDVIETVGKAVPATFLFLSYMEPRCHMSKGKTREGETGKRDYRPLWWFGEIVDKFLLYLSGIKGKNN